MKVLGVDFDEYASGAPGMAPAVAEEPSVPSSGLMASWPAGLVVVAAMALAL